MSQSDSCVKLDKLGETQQMLVMLSIMREMMKPSEKPIPQPPPRPPQLASFKQDWFNELVCSWFAYEPFTDQVIGYVDPVELTVIKQQLNSIQNNLASTLSQQCWYVELPNQPVMLQVNKCGIAEVWEILSWPEGDETSHRLGWLPVGAMSNVKSAIHAYRSDLKDSRYIARFLEHNKDPGSRQYNLSCFRPLWIKSRCAGIIIDNWLYLTDVITHTHGS